MAVQALHDERAASVSPDLADGNLQAGIVVSDCFV
jgi:hypothetical protein